MWKALPIVQSLYIFTDSYKKSKPTEVRFFISFAQGQESIALNYLDVSYILKTRGLFVMPHAKQNCPDKQKSPTNCEKK